MFEEIPVEKYVKGFIARCINPCHSVRHSASGQDRFGIVGNFCNSVVLWLKNSVLRTD